MRQIGMSIPADMMHPNVNGLLSELNKSFAPSSKGSNELRPVYLYMMSSWKRLSSVNPKESAKSATPNVNMYEI